MIDDRQRVTVAVIAEEELSDKMKMGCFTGRVGRGNRDFQLYPSFQYPYGNMSFQLRLSLLLVLPLLGSCTATKVRDAWWSEPSSQYNCSRAVLPPFELLVGQTVTDVFKRLDVNPAVSITREEGIKLLPKWRPVNDRDPIYLVRALITNPHDGQMTVTSCEDILFVSYVAPPTRLHRGTRRAAVLVTLPNIPKEVVVNAGEGVP